MICDHARRLTSIYRPSVQLNNDKPASSSSSAKSASSDEVDDLTPSQKAERAKAAGNDRFKAGQYQVSYARALSCKIFLTLDVSQPAIDLYSEAIDHDSEEASYYTNRAAAYSEQAK